MTATLLLLTPIVALMCPPDGGLCPPQSLKEIARQNGGKATVSSDVNLPALPLSEMVHQSDLIVEARITGKQGVLSADESTVCTEYVLLPIKVLKRRRADLERTSPGATSPLIVRQPGGHVTVDGLELTVESNLFTREGLDLNGVYIMFLQSDPAERRFKFLRGPYGVFKIDGGALVPPPGDAATAKRPLPKDRDTLYAEIQRLEKAPR